MRKRSTAITVRAPASARRGEVGVGEVGQRVGAEQDEHVDLALGGGLQDARWRRGPAAAARAAQPRSLEPAGPVRQGHAAREEPGREPHVEGAVHVAAPQRAEEPHLGVGGVDRGGGGDDAVGGLGQVGPPEDDGDRTGGQQRPRRPAMALGLDAADLLVGRRRRAAPRTTSPAAPGRCSSVAAASSDTERALRGELDDRDAVADHGVAEAQEEDRQLLLQVGREQQHGAARRADLVDRGARQPEHDLGGEPVAELRVDVVGVAVPTISIASRSRDRCPELSSTRVFRVLPSFPTTNPTSRVPSDPNRRLAACTFWPSTSVTLARAKLTSFGTCVGSTIAASDFRASAQ